MENNRSFLSVPTTIAIDHSQDPSLSDGKLNFDEDTLRAIAQVYLEEGDKEYEKKEVFNAIYFYTEGIQVNCKNDELNAKLYCNRATANYHLGNYQEALNNATAAVKLEPTLSKAIEAGEIHRGNLIMRTPPIHLQTPLLCVKKSITIIPNSCRDSVVINLPNENHLLQQFNFNSNLTVEISTKSRHYQNDVTQKTETGTKMTKYLEKDGDMDPILT